MTATPLQWEELPPSQFTKVSRRADTDCGLTYFLGLHDYGDGKPRWQAGIGRFLMAEEIYCGESESEAIEAVEAHRAARVRRLAWERYMLDNDPPKADLEARVNALESPPCCEGGPQWGHAWTCPKCPD